MKKSTWQDKIIGNSAAVAMLKEQIARSAKINATVLIEGETGSGKEVVANAIFQNSDRTNGNFIKLNCAAIPQELMESELLGYVEGSFTGAAKGGKKGKFELANRGTILLDEINSLSLPAQAKLLRVLQEKEVDRIGGEKPIPVDVRVIAISNKPLHELVAKGLFREDLYYRLNVIKINVPPLRERKSDIPDLVKHFIKIFNKEMNKHVEQVDMSVYNYLKSYEWPGNIRELQNFIERAMTTVWKDILTLSNFYWINEHSNSDSYNNDKISAASGLPLLKIMENVERDIILRTLAENGGNKSKTAEQLNIARQILYRKMKILGISWE